MKKRYLLSAAEGIAFKISGGEDGQLLMKAVHTSKKDEYSTNYSNPPIPKGYKHILGTWESGFVIEKNDYFDKSQFVWIPVGFLETNGTLDGKTYDEKFGRRNYRSAFAFEDKAEPHMYNVKKYGGFYISRYAISKSKDGKPQSVKGQMPWTNVTRSEAQWIADQFCHDDDVKAHLPFGAEYDSVFEWLFETRQKSYNAIFNCSSSWGNYWDSSDAAKKILPTGSNEKWCAGQIYDLAGNIAEWTQESTCNEGKPISRGGAAQDSGEEYNAFKRSIEFEATFAADFIGFRISLLLR